MNEPDEIVLQHIDVSYDYPVVFTSDVFDPSNPLFRDAVSRKERRRRHRVLAVLDRGVGNSWPKLADDLLGYANRHHQRIDLMRPPIDVAGGEAAKNDPRVVASLQQQMLAAGVDRHSCVAVIGGGAVLDAVGFAAATVHRGVRVVRVPTTVLAQCDSGVGVKNAVNACGLKNAVGTFAPPFAVLNDRRFLATLAHRDLIAGMAEAVKVALVRDADFFAWLEGRVHRLAAGDLDAVADLIRRSARLHLAHITGSGDPFECGSARPLDFGHWAAHKLESMTAHRLRHGEAVAIGIALDVAYSAISGLLPDSAAARIIALLQGLGFQVWDQALASVASDGRLTVLDGLEEFREHLGGELTITLLEDIGRGTEVHAIRDDLVRRALDLLQARAGEA